MRRVITAALGGALVAATLTMSPAAAYAQAADIPTYTCTKVEPVGTRGGYHGNGSCHPSKSAQAADGRVETPFLLVDQAGKVTVCVEGRINLPFWVDCHTRPLP